MAIIKCHDFLLSFERNPLSKNRVLFGICSKIVHDSSAINYNLNRHQHRIGHLILQEILLYSLEISNRQEVTYHK